MRYVFPSAVVAACAAAWSGGCASLDPTHEIEQAESLVAARSEAAPDWTAPWDVPDGAWDGRTALSSETAVRVALQNNRAIRREVETIVAARADYVQAHLLPNPVINFAYGFPTDGLGGNPLMFSLVQQVAWLWRRPVAIDAAEATTRRRVLEVSDAALRLVADVRLRHAEVVTAERAVDFQRANVALIERTRTLLDAQYAVGEASRLDVNRVALDMERARARLADREAALASARRSLLEMLGRAADSADWITDDRLPDARPTGVEQDEAAVIALAMTQRLDVAAANVAVDGRRAELGGAELDRLPDVGAGVSYQENFADRPAWSPVVQVTPKVFDDGRANVASALSALRQAEIRADGVRQHAVGEARRAWVTLHAGLDALDAYEVGVVRAAEENTSMARASLEAGEGDLTVLLETERALTAARLEVVDRQRDVAANLIELERAVGGALAVQPEVAISIEPNGVANNERSRP